jgi:hypothetical protein
VAEFRSFLWHHPLKKICRPPTEEALEVKTSEQVHLNRTDVLEILLNFGDDRSWRLRVGHH